MFSELGATAFYSVGCTIESCWDRQYFQWDARSVLIKAVNHAATKKILWYQPFPFSTD
jgi:hypothetical protein